MHRCIRCMTEHPELVSNLCAHCKKTTTLLNDMKDNPDTYFCTACKEIGYLCTCDNTYHWRKKKKSLYAMKQN